MSDENNVDPGTTENQPDPVQNVKAEMQRKLDNQNAELSKLQQQMQALLQTKEPPKDQSIEEEFDVYDPQTLKKAVQKQVQAGISTFQQQQQQFMQQEQKRAQVIASVVAEYPEFQNPSSEVVKEAQQILATFDPAEQTSPAAYKAAMLEAASNKGLIPKSKRGSGDDSFQLGGSKPRGGKREEDVPAGVEAWRQTLMPYANIKLDDKAVQERIKERSKKYSGGKK